MSANTWFNRNHSSIALSTLEAEYIATCSTSTEVVWMGKMLEILFDAEIDVIDIHCDNQICIKMIENSMFLDKSKHIEIRYHYVWDMVQKRAVKVKYISIEEEMAVVYTKHLYHVMFEYFREKIGVV